MKNQHGIDLGEVIQNASAEGIDLSEITLFYSNLTVDELNELKRMNLLTEKSNARAIGRFNSEGLALFPEKVSEVYYLGA